MATLEERIENPEAKLENLVSEVNFNFQVCEGQLRELRRLAEAVKKIGTEVAAAKTEVDEPVR